MDKIKLIAGVIIFFSLIMIILPEERYFCKLPNGGYNEYHEKYDSIEVTSTRECENLCDYLGKDFYVGGYVQHHFGCESEPITSPTKLKRNGGGEE